MILAGGVGSRFWPVSTPARPKQLLPLASDRPLLRDTVDRILPLVPRERLRILTGAHLAEPILAALPDLGPENLLLEPRAAGTAPVLAWAAAELERLDPAATMISLHADHVIDPAEAFRACLRTAVDAAREHHALVTIGAVPDRPETGYGYIEVGEPLNGRANRVAKFVEKPDRETAAAYLAGGEHLWNTGLFVWEAALFLDELRRRTPELAAGVELLRAGDVESFFERTPTLSVDEGLLERSERVVVVSSTFDWDDVGTWDALFRTRPSDGAGNVRIGEAFSVESQGTALYADEGAIVAFGVEDLVVVRTGEVTLVAHRDRVAELKALLPELPEQLRSGE
ncbi:mannose-1-phosphate guanylyltransferase [soil metagenome]